MSVGCMLNIRMNVNSMKQSWCNRNQSFSSENVILRMQIKIPSEISIHHVRKQCIELIVWFYVIETIQYVVVYLSATAIVSFATNETTHMLFALQFLQNGHFNCEHFLGLTCRFNFQCNLSATQSSLVFDKFRQKLPPPIWFVALGQQEITFLMPFWSYYFDA